MKFTTAIFDLDGTLLDSLADVAHSVNHALKENNFQTQDVDQVKKCFGNGVHALIGRLLPSDCPNQTYEKVLADFMAHYALHKNDNSQPFEGMMELLKELKARGIKTAILSNKPDVQTKPLAKEVFGQLIDYARGQRNDVPAKPNPDGVYQILEILDSKAEECVFIGDSDVDINTGKNANIYTIGVSWGYRTTEELKRTGADYIVNKAEEILKVF